MKKLIICAVVAWMPVVCSAQANDMELLGFGTDIHGSIDLTYQTQYVWRGFDVFTDDDPAVQLTANLDLFNSGFGITVAGHRATEKHLNPRGWDYTERWDYNLYYTNAIFKGETFATNYRFGFVHYNFPKIPAKDLDLEELHLILFWPSATGVKGLVPSYALVKLWPAYQGSPGVGDNASGFAHIFMLDYSFAVPGAYPDTPEQIFKIHSELVYNDGVSPLNTDVDHDWSNWVVGISTDIELGYGFTLTPAGYYQYSLDSSVNPDNELWGTIGVRYNF